MAETNEKSLSKKDIWKCKTCHITYTDIYSYTDHLESKEHTKGLMKQKYGPKYLEAKEMLDEKSSKANVKSENTSDHLKKSDSNNSDETDSSEEDVYTCDVCEKICTGMLNYKLHLSGNKHLKKLKQLKTMKELEKKNLVPNGYKSPDEDLLSQITSKTQTASSDIICELCNVKCTGPEVFMKHTKGDPHKKKEAKLRLKKEMEAEGMPANSSKIEFDESYCCDTCGKAFSGVIPYKQHLESLAHRNKDRDNQKLEKVKELCITSPQNSKLQCKECKKMFSGPGPFEEHLKNFSHGKLKKKNDMYEELEKNYPEMVKTSIKENSESEDSDEDEVRPACRICNVIFSGPQTALDHFQSAKHKKALKKKKRLDKVKTLKTGDKSLKKSSNSKKETETKAAEYSSDESFERLSP